MYTFAILRGWPKPLNTMIATFMRLTTLRSYIFISILTRYCVAMEPRRLAVTNPFWDTIEKFIDNKIPKPSSVPSANPSSFPSFIPSSRPSNEPSLWASFHPSSSPSLQPSPSPSTKPSSEPSYKPSLQPSSSPSLQPSSSPSIKPSFRPSFSPSMKPSSEPSYKPSLRPSSSPSKRPSSLPSRLPSTVPSAYHSTVPSLYPSIVPTLIQSKFPSSSPTSSPSSKPTLSPSQQPSQYPIISPSLQPSISHSLQPSGESSLMPSLTPTALSTQRFDINLVLVLDHTGSSLSQENDAIFRSTTTDFASKCISNFDSNLGIEGLSIEISSQEMTRNGLEVEFILSGTMHACKLYMIRVAVTKCFEIQHHELDAQLQASLLMDDDKNPSEQRGSNSGVLFIGVGVLSIALISIVFGLIYVKLRSKARKRSMETSHDENVQPGSWSRVMANRSSSRELPDFTIDAFIEDESIQDYVDAVAYECSEVSSITYY